MVALARERPHLGYVKEESEPLVDRMKALVAARPPMTRIAHAFQAGPSGMTMLIYGTRRPNDAVWYPRSNKIFWRGLGVIGRIEALDYWDGEPTDE